MKNVKKKKLKKWVNITGKELKKKNRKKVRIKRHRKAKARKKESMEIKLKNPFNNILSLKVNVEVEKNCFY